MLKKFLFIILISIAVLSCHKLCVPRQYNFRGGIANIYPDKDSIQIGDTLLFNCSIPLELKYSVGANSDSGNYDISGATNFTTDFHLTALLGINMQAGAMDSFSFIPVKGSFKLNPLDPHASKTIFYIQNSSRYIFSISMVAKQKGIYLLSIIDIYQGMKKCDKFSVTITMDNADNHLHYLKDIYYGGGAISPIDLTHSYCFKVY